MAQERREKSARERRDIMQKDVAAAVGTTPTTLSRWEAGEVMPKDAVLKRLAEYFGVTPAWLRYGQEPRQAEQPSRPEPQHVDPAIVQPVERESAQGRRKAK